MISFAISVHSGFAKFEIRSSYINISSSELKEKGFQNSKSSKNKHTEFKELKELKEIKNHLKSSIKNKANTGNVPFIMDQIGSISLINKIKISNIKSYFADLRNNTKHLIEYEKTYTKDDRTGIELAFEEWELALNDLSYKSLSNTKQSFKADYLYQMGTSLYLSYILKDQESKGSKSNHNFNTGDLKKSEKYLITLLLNYPKHKKIPEVLTIISKIKTKNISENDIFIKNFYNKELIRRYPHSTWSELAWHRYYDNIVLDFSGSGGDFTPLSIIRNLELYRELSIPENKLKLKKINNRG
jgi:hypothetical protein